MLTIQKQKKYQQFDEVSIANLGFCQIIVPSSIQLTPKCLGQAEVLVPKRIYATEGQIVVDGEEVAVLQELKFEAIVSDGTPFKISPRLGPAIPLSFESRSETSLPQSLMKFAIMTCKIPKTVYPFYAIFRRIKPRFVRTYEAVSALSTKNIVRIMLAEEIRFVAENYSHLRSVPFYREQYGL